MFSPHGLITAGVTLISAYNYYSLLPASNPTNKEVTLEEGTIIGYATVYTDERHTGSHHEYMKIQFMNDDGDHEPLFEGGGRPRNAADLRTLGFDLTTAIDPDRPLPEGEGLIPDRHHSSYPWRHHLS